MKNRQTRVAIGTIFTECNQLGGVPITLDWFERYELLRGEDILTLDSGVAGGMLQVLYENGINVVPLLYASTCPGGPLTTECYTALKDDLLNTLRESLSNDTSVDGVLLPLHGAACVETIGDLEGDIIKAVRQIVGDAIPIVVTLDLHAHVTADMVRDADALLAWETYPHADAFTTGQRGAQMMVDILAGRCHPTMAMAKVPVITSAIHGSTEGDDPFAYLMREAKVLEDQVDVLSTSMILVHPYLDQADMGSGAIVITDDDLDGAIAKADALAHAYWSRRFELEPQTWTPAQAIAEALQLDGDGPILLVETSDCCGGGAAGDSIATLAALLATDVQETALVPVVDPNAAQHCHDSGVGAMVTLTLGHQQDPRWGRPIAVTGRVEHLSDGKFIYDGGIFDGVVGEMGPSAVLEIGSIRVLITTYATYDWQDEQFRSVNLDPTAATFIVAKNPMNFRMAYGDVAQAVFILDTPGPTPPTLRHVNFQQLAQPYFPVDEDIPNLNPTILT
ncbi:MAG: M81 family metallopeptidase [Chloroflexota bacterium]